MQRAIQQLQEREQQITQRTLSKQMGVSQAVFTYYSRLKSLYHQIMKEQKQKHILQAKQREAALLGQVQCIIKDMEEQNKPIILREIARSMGITVASLSKYESIRMLFQHIRSEERKKMRAK